MQKSTDVTTDRFAARAATSKNGPALVFFDPGYLY